MELDAKKCNEMIVDFRKTVIPPVCIGQQHRVSENVQGTLDE